jgi:hypothetical protein
MMPNIKLLLEQFTDTALIKNFLSFVFYRTQRSVTGFTKLPVDNNNLSQFNPSCISPCSYKKHFNAIHSCLDIPADFLPGDFPAKILMHLLA